MFARMGRHGTVVVAALRGRRDGWTVARQRVFLEVLADTGRVSEAARRAGMSRVAAYRLRRHPAAADFAYGWDLAVLEAMRRVEEVALERALWGEEEALLRDGVVVAVRRRPCDVRLLVKMLERADGYASGCQPERAQHQQFRVQLDALVDRSDLAGLEDEAPLAVAGPEQVPADLVAADQNSTKTL
jgi:hypothetical protein